MTVNRQDADWSPRVFISYAHDTTEHKELVQEFGAFLRTEAGVDARLDRWADGVRRDWSAWATRELTDADYVLVIASPAYRRRADGLAPPEEGRGSQFEAAIIRNNLTRNLPAETARVLPVVLPGRSVDEIPVFLNAYSTTHYLVPEFTIDAIAPLLAAFTGRPEHEMPQRGPFVGFRNRGPDTVVALRKPAAGLLLTSLLKPVLRSQDIRMTAAELAGTHYGDSIVFRPSLFANDTRGAVEYNLSRRYRAFHAVAGVLDDASDSGQTGYFQVFLDGRPQPQVRAVLGEPAVISQDVTGVLRIRLVAYRQGTVGNPILAGARMAGGQSNHLPELAWGNPTLAE